MDRSILGSRTAIAIVGLACLYTSQSIAGSSNCSSTIERIETPYHEPWQADWMDDIATRNRDRADRATGEVDHPMIGNTLSDVVFPINGGSVDWKFKALADSAGGGKVRYDEIHAGIEGTEKPFIAVDDGRVNLGTST